MGKKVQQKPKIPYGYRVVQTYRGNGIWASDRISRRRAMKTFRLAISVHPTLYGSHQNRFRLIVMSEATYTKAVRRNGGESR